MANKQHAQFSDENGNLFYLESETEDVLDPSGKPLSDGGDLSEASVKFSVDTSRKLPQSGGRFKAFLGSIVKYLTDLGAAAYLAVANNDTTTQPGFVGDARVLKQHRDAINQLSSDMRIKTVQKIHGNSQSGHVVINISFSTDNGCVTLLVSAGRFLLFISVELDLVTSTLSPNGVEYYSPYSGGKEIKSVVATSAIPGSYRVKITTDAIITAYDVVAISGEIDNLQVGSAAG